MTAYAQRERDSLADLLSEVGPQAATRCGDWTAADLAAHLVARDRRPDSGPGLLLAPLAGWTETVRRRTLASHSFPELTEMVRRPPWWSPVSNPLVHESANLMEYFIHHEDLRRAAPDWQPRDLPDDLEATLWRRLRTLKLLLRKTPAGVVLHAPGHGELRAGRGGVSVRVTGPPSELMIFCSGRQPVARVTLEGPDGPAQQLREANFSL
ncbi:MAG: TIGR03085 family metal-binding protein [Micromonosporaceae bacterium]